MTALAPDVSAQLDAAFSCGILNASEKRRLDELEYQRKRHGERFQQPLNNYVQRLLSAAAARRAQQQQQPLIDAPLTAADLHQDSVHQHTLRMREAARQREREQGRSGERIELPELQPLDGVTFVDARRTGARQGRTRQQWDVEAIKRSNPPAEVLQRYGITVTNGKCRCPVHRGDSTQSMSVTRDYVNCHVGRCGFAGDVIKLVRALEGLPEDGPEGFHAACEILGGQRVSSVGTYTPVARAVEPEQPAVVQHDLRPLAGRAAVALQEQKSAVSREAAAYLAGRGLSLEACWQLGIGVVDDSIPYNLLPLTGKGKHHLGWRNRITVPDLGRGNEVLYLKARAFRDNELCDTRTGEAREKYLNPYGMRTRPFNLDRIPETGSVLLVEGELDCLSVLVTGLTRAVIAVPGVNNLNREHAERLAARGGTVYLLLDPDVQLFEEGGDSNKKVKAQKVVKLLGEAGCDLRLVEPLSDNPDDDLNALLIKWGARNLRDELLDHMQRATPLKS